MEIIVAVDNNWGIGYENNLLIHIPKDLKNFKELTTNNIIIYGRKTLSSFRGSKPLPNRTNVILTRGMLQKETMNIREIYELENVVIKTSLESTLSYIKEQEQLGNKVYIIGGEQIYNMFLDYCEGAYVTKIFNSYLANKHFPNIDKMENWEITQNILSDIVYDKENVCNTEYNILYYKNNKVKEY